MPSRAFSSWSGQANPPCSSHGGGHPLQSGVRESKGVHLAAIWGWRAPLCVSLVFGDFISLKPTMLEKYKGDARYSEGNCCCILKMRTQKAWKSKGKARFPPLGVSHLGKPRKAIIEANDNIWRVFPSASAKALTPPPRETLNPTAETWDGPLKI